MKKKSLVLLFFYTCISFSQNFSINYLVKKGDLKQNFILDVNNNKSLFYSEEYCDTNILEIHNYLVVEKNDNEPFLIYHDQVEELDVNFKATSKLIWNLTNEKKFIEDIELFKAITIYKEREWIAWYNPEIAINYGPFIFCDLPGLIYEISSNDLEILFVNLKAKNINCYEKPENEEIIDINKYNRYNSDLIKILKESYKKTANESDNSMLQDLILSSLKKDLFREFL